MIDGSFFFPRLKVFFPASVIRDKQRGMKGGKERGEGGEGMGGENERKREKENEGGGREKKGRKEK